MTASGQSVTGAPPAVRSALRTGRVQDIPALLGSYWRVRGVVEHGDARGRTMGFPTANMHLPDGDFLAYGIYAVRVGIEGAGQTVSWHDGVASFGIRPMYKVSRPLLETNLFDFTGDLYGKTLTVELIAWLRAEAKFPSLEALIAQIGADARQARLLLQPGAQRQPRKWMATA